MESASAHNLFDGSLHGTLHFAIAIWRLQIFSKILLTEGSPYVTL